MPLESDASHTYPEGHVDLLQMNRALRHRLRNLVAGVQMTIDRISDTVASDHPAVVEKCDIITSELHNLQTMTDRMDLLFDTLPAPEKKSLLEIISTLDAFFRNSYPFSCIEVKGEPAKLSYPAGNLLLTALKEILVNAGNAAGKNGIVKLSWSVDTKDNTCTFTVKNSGKKIPKEIPLTPPQPFTIQHGKGDGLGLAIVERICNTLHSELSIDNSNEKYIIVKISMPSESFII